MNLLKRYWVAILTFCILALFLWLRLNRIEESFFFRNDQGRDMLVLFDWYKTGKPPLLGPQTSVLPINQSSIYFYLLYPGFLLSNFEPISANITMLVIYVFLIVGGIRLLNEDKELLWMFVVGFLMISIHPLYVLQNRMIWNPSFVGPSLLFSLVFLLRWLKNDNKKDLFIHSLTMALAVSFSYSVVPIMISVWLYIFFAYRSKTIPLLLATILFLGLVNATTIIFEFRHGFLMTSSLLSRGVRLQGDEVVSLASRLKSLSAGVFFTNKEILNTILSVSFILLALLTALNKKSHKSSRTISLLLILSILFSLSVSTEIYAHYTYGLTMLLFLLISTYSKIIGGLIISFFAFIYLSPMNLNSYFSPPQRSMEEMRSCFDQVCMKYTEPVFVTVQSNFHPWHVGPEHRFLLKRAGCDVKYLEENPSIASTMIVVMDGSNYEHGNTVYGELASFGNATEVERFECKENFGAVVLKKNNYFE